MYKAVQELYKSCTIYVQYTYNLPLCDTLVSRVAL